MPETDYQEVLTERGCLFLNTEGHFVGNSGRHLTGYCNIDPLLPDVGFVSHMVKDMVKPFIDDGVEAILTAAVGAIPLGHLAARHLMELTGTDVQAVWADKKIPRGQEITRNGFISAISGKRLLIMDGVVNSMFTAGELKRNANEIGSIVLGMSAVAANKDVSAATLSISRFSYLTDAHYDTWEPDECAQKGPCSAGIPIVVDEPLGHGKQFQDENPDYSGGFIKLLG